MECILNLSDPHFDAILCQQYRLSVLLCQDGFSFLVAEAATGKVLKLASYRFPNAESGKWPSTGYDYFDFLKTTEFAQYSFQQVDIAVASTKITTAPSAFFGQGSDISIMEATHDVDAGEQVLYTPVFDLGPGIAIAVPAYIKEFCDVVFPANKMQSAAAVFVKGIIRKHAQLISRQIFLNMYAGFFEIAVVQGSRLLYLNAFKYTATSDVLYYVIFVLEQLGFVPAEENIILAGEISEREIIFNQLKMYCASLSYAAVPDGIECGEVFSGLDLHTYFTLLNLPLCE